MSVPFGILSIVAAAFAAFVFGFLVHGPLLGSVWLKLMKITPEQQAQGMKEMQGKMPYYMAAAFVQQLVVATAVSYFAYMTYASTVTDALTLAVWAWLGFTAMPLLNGVLWEKRSVPLYGFNIAYQLASVAIISLIVTLW